MDSLIKDGHVTRGYLGVMIQDVTPALAKEFKLKDIDRRAHRRRRAQRPRRQGRPQERRRRARIQRQEGHRQPPPQARGGRDQARHDRAGEDPARWHDQDPRGHRARTARHRTTRPEQQPERASDTGTLNGVTVSDLDQQTRQQLKVPENVKGVVVTEVQPDSPAAEAGLKPGDVIQEINRQPVKTAEEAVRLTENPKDKITLLRVWSNGGSHYVVVDESKAG